MSRALLPLLRRHPVWADASDATLAHLAEGGRLIERGAGQMLVIDGTVADAIWLLVDGTTRVFYPAKKGQPEVTQSWGAPGDGAGDDQVVVAAACARPRSAPQRRRCGASGSTAAVVMRSTSRSSTRYSRTNVSSRSRSPPDMTSLPAVNDAA